MWQYGAHSGLSLQPYDSINALGSAQIECDAITECAAPALNSLQAGSDKLLYNSCVWAPDDIAFNEHLGATLD